jgi:hypothetical protein
MGIFWEKPAGSGLERKWQRLKVSTFTCFDKVESRPNRNPTDHVLARRCFQTRAISKITSGAKI